MKGLRWLWLVVVVAAGASGCVVTTDTCDDLNNNGICDVDECVDANNNGICDIDEGVCYYDADADGICDDVDPCIGSEADTDGDGVCDGEDISDCIDDLTGADLCADPCTAADNTCSTAWDLVYCNAGEWYTADCQTSCMTDQATWSQVCAAPALAGECSGADFACLCWCEDSFDSCVNDYTVQYTRDGNTFQVDCKDYCFGSCDANIGACACP
jgi:hypothetical protein